MENINKNIIEFNDEESSSISQVGGKGYSLIKMTKFGLNVPNGFILTVDFFSDWIKELQLSKEWNDYLNASLDDVEDKFNLITKVKIMSQNLKLTESQKNVINSHLLKMKECKIFAVRSSSPDEDLDNASFAGGYETLLGVTLDKLESSIVKVFSSCLDIRIFKYKYEKGNHNNLF